MLVAGDPPPEQVFQTVTEEVCGLLGSERPCSSATRTDETSTSSASTESRRNEFELGSTAPARGRGRARRVANGRAHACRDYDGLVGSGADAAVARLPRQRRRADHRRRRDLGRTGRGAARAGESLPVETERRLQAFAELVALALASAHARDRACRVAVAHRRGERRRAATARAQPARRRAAAARRALGRPTARPGEDLQALPRKRRELLAVPRGGSGRSADRAARARPGDPPRACSPSAASRLRWRCSQRAHRCRSPSTCSCPSGCRSRWRRPPTTSSPSRSRTSSSTPAPPRPPSAARTHRRARAVEVQDDGVGGARSGRRLGPARPSRPRRDARRQAPRSRASSAGTRVRAGLVLRGALPRVGGVTLTFFFSDIEDSTGLLARLGGGYSAILARPGSFSAMRSGKRVAGRSTAAATSSSASSTVQRRQPPRRSRSSGRSRPIRGRSGNGCGYASACTPATPKATTTAIVGIDVHRASRICQAAHGGQTLASAEALGRRPLAVQRPRPVRVQRASRSGARSTSSSAKGLRPTSRRFGTFASMTRRCGR